MMLSWPGRCKSRGKYPGNVQRGKLSAELSGVKYLGQGMFGGIVWGELSSGETVGQSCPENASEENVLIPIHDYKSVCTAVLSWLTHTQTVFDRLYY